MGAVYLSYSAYFLSADFNGIRKFMRVNYDIVMLTFNCSIGYNRYSLSRFGHHQY
jgi:hypothetical protein